MTTLEALDQHKNYEKIIIQFTLDDLAVLVGRIRDYIVKLAVENVVELTEDEIDERKSNDAISDLWRPLVESDLLRCFPTHPLIWRG